MLSLKNDDNNLVSFNVRLNLNKPRHQETWKRLQNSPFSHTVTIVNALTAQPEQLPWYADSYKVKGIIREAIAEVLGSVPVTMPPAASMQMTMEPVHESNDEISDEDFNISQNFISSL